MQEVCIIVCNLFFTWQCISIINKPFDFGQKFVILHQESLSLRNRRKVCILLLLPLFWSILLFLFKNILLEVNLFEKRSLLLQRISFTLVARYLFCNYIFLAYRSYTSLTWNYGHYCLKGYLLGVEGVYPCF